MSHLDSLHVSDGIQRAGNAVERNAQIAGARLVRGKRPKWAENRDGEDQT
jgi:hypothetical protein